MKRQKWDKFGYLIISILFKLEFPKEINETACKYTSQDFVK